MDPEPIRTKLFYNTALGQFVGSPEYTSSHLLFHDRTKAIKTEAISRNLLQRQVHFQYTFIQRILKTIDNARLNAKHTKDIRATRKLPSEIPSSVSLRYSFTGIGRKGLHKALEKFPLHSHR